MRLPGRCRPHRAGTKTDVVDAVRNVLRSKDRHVTSNLFGRAMIRLCTGLVICSGFALSAGAATRVWVAPATLKILKTDEPQNAPGLAKLSAGRREVAAFQIAVRSDHDLHDLKQSGNLKGARLTIWREHYLQTTREGERPDPLTPIAELSLPANTTQPFFLEVEVPADARPGAHTGNIEIHDSKEDSFVPVELNVHDFDLPITPGLRTAFGNQPQFVPFETVPKDGPE